MAVDLRKSFDSVPHEAIIDAVRTVQLGVLTLNVIKVFLATYFTEDLDRRYDNKVGVRQGSILCHVSKPSYDGTFSPVRQFEICVLRNTQTT